MVLFYAQLIPEERQVEELLGVKFEFIEGVHNGVVVAQNEVDIQSGSIARFLTPKVL